MAYSYTEKKRIRKNFGKLPRVMDIPYLLAIQVESYNEFLQEEIPVEDKILKGLHAAFKSVSLSLAIQVVLGSNTSVIGWVSRHSMLKSVN